MASGETYITLKDGTVVGNSNPMPTQGVAGATADIKVHGNNFNTRWIEPNADGSLNVRAEGLHVIAAGQATVGLNGAAALVVGVDTSRLLLILRNVSIHTVYVGPLGVTTSTGFPIPAGQEAKLPTVDAVYFCSAQSADVLGYIEFN